jgi:hypothetical protein
MTRLAGRPDIGDFTFAALQHNVVRRVEKYRINAESIESDNHLDLQFILGFRLCGC